jgi:hypothetical protein
MSNPQDPENWAEVYEATDEWSANLVLQALRDAGIPSVVEPRAVPGFGGALSSETGVWADVMVPADLLARAREVIAVDTAPSEALAEGESPEA